MNTARARGAAPGGPTPRSIHGKAVALECVSPTWTCPPYSRVQSLFEQRHKPIQIHTLTAPAICAAAGRSPPIPPLPHFHDT